MEKIRLPHDSLTPGQLKERNGKMMGYNLGQPMKWQALLDMPADLRREYLEKLRDEYQANQVMVADMLGISVHTLRRRCKEWGVKFHPTGGHVNTSALDRWAEFTGKHSKPTDKKETQEPAPAKREPLVPRSGTMTFHGPACEALRTMTFHGPACEALRTMEAALRGSSCTLTITWETED